MYEKVGVKQHSLTSQSKKCGPLTPYCALNLCSAFGRVVKISIVGLKLNNQHFGCILTNHAKFRGCACAVSRDPFVGG